MRRALAAYCVVFLLTASPWIGSAGHAVPRLGVLAPLVSPDDARMICWAFGWIAHATVAASARLLDAPINYPAPAQLTGSEHFASSVLVAAPVFWSTGNAVLAANAVALVSYPLAALAMDRLLVALGCDALVAWTGGLLFMFGPLRVPGNLQILQYPNVYLPLLALVLLRLRRRTDLRWGVIFALVLLAAMFSSYHMALMSGVVVALWAGRELVNREPGRGRFILVAAGVVALDAGLLLLVSRSYFGRAEAQASVVPDFWRQPPGLLWFFVGLFMRRWFGTIALLLATIGVPALLFGRSAARRTAAAGLLFTIVSAVLILPPAPIVHLLAASPARFLRAPWRFVVVAGLGTALLGAAGLEAVRERLPERAGRLVLALVALAVAIDRGRALVGAGLDEIHPMGRDRPVYDAVTQATAGDPGALLELPLHDARAEEHESPIYRGSLEPDAMVGGTRHWLPLLVGHTGYTPPHRRLVDATIDRLPRADALADLVDMTHVRWLLLRPEEYWEDAASRAAILRLPEVRIVLARDGWILARVDRPPRHSGWFAAIAGGSRAGSSLLGTPLRRLAPVEAAAGVAVTDAPRVASAGRPLALDVAVANLGMAGWPVATAGGDPRYTVQLVARWRGGGDGDAVARIPLARDVPAGERLAQRVALPAPLAPGAYDLELALEQVGGARLGGPAAVLDLPVEVVPPG